MNYDWNKMVDITVPTGTNGWIYSGEVIINGVKVRFPVGTPTNVPEPAAELLKKMIELEQNEADGAPRPGNTYVGSLTVPAGATLKLEEGAKVEDEAGILAAAPAAPAPTVILPETEAQDIDGSLSILTPLAAPMVAGAMYKVTYNGVKYECPALDASALMPGLFLLGNGDTLGIPGGNADAPFALMVAPSGIPGPAGETAYVTVSPLDDATSVTLSIVGEAGTDSGGDTGGGIFTVNVPVTVYNSETGHDFGAFDKTFAEMAGANSAGKYVRISMNWSSGYSIYGTVIGIAGMGSNAALVVSAPVTLMNPQHNVVYMLGAGADGEIVAQFIGVNT